MLRKIIDKLRIKLENALAAEEVDREKILELSVTLDKYIVEYIRGELTRRAISESDKNDYQ